MKALVLTDIEISQSDRELINNVKLFKVCVNWARYASDVRLVKDRKALKWLKINFPRDKILHIGVDTDIYFKYGTIVSAVHYAKQFAGEVLIIGDNTKHSDKFQNQIKEELSNMENVYQFRNGNFNLPAKSLRGFLND